MLRSRALPRLAPWLVALACAGCATTGLSSLPGDRSHLNQAQAQVTQAVGHPIELLLRRGHDGAEADDAADVLAQDLDRLAQELRELAAEWPVLYERHVRPWRRLVLRPGPRDRRGFRVEYDAGRGEMIVDVPPRARNFLPVQQMIDPFFEAYIPEAEARLLRVAPEALSPPERKDLLVLLTVLASPPDEVYARWRLRRLRWADVVELVERIDALNEPELEPRTRTFLAKQVTQSLESLYAERDPARASAWTDGTSQRVEAAWSRWFQRSYGRLSDEQQQAVLRSVFVEPGGSAVALTRGARGAFPGVDKLGLGLAALRRWAEAGHPLNHDPQKFREVDNLLARVQSEPGGPPSRSDGTTIFYEWVLKDPERMRLFAAALVALRDDLVTRTVFRNFWKQGIPAALQALQAVEPDERTWRVAVDVMALDAVDRLVPMDHALLAEYRRLWATHPARRDATLFLLALTYNRRSPEDFSWAAFDKHIGPPPSADVFARYLDHGPWAFVYARYMWHLLPSPARTRALVERLDAFTEASRKRPLEPGDPRTSIVELGELLAQRQAQDELGLLHAWAQRRRGAHPDEARWLDDVIKLAAPRGSASPPAAARGDLVSPWTGSGAPRRR